MRRRRARVDSWKIFYIIQPKSPSILRLIYGIIYGLNVHQLYGYMLHFM